MRRGPFSDAREVDDEPRALRRGRRQPDSGLSRFSFALAALLVAGATVGGLVATASPATAASIGATLYTNKSLSAGQSLDNGPFSLVMQGDGNFVTYSASGATWASGTVGGQDELLASNVFHQAWTHLNAYPYNNQIARMRQTSRPAPGDLVFFGSSTSNTDHVGIYIGGRRMIDALQTGTRIQINNISDAGGFLGYWHY